MILLSNYQTINTNDVVQQCCHLNSTQCCDLANLLRHHQSLFSGKLGCYPHGKVHIHLTSDAEPHRTRAYTVSQAHTHFSKKNWTGVVGDGHWGVGWKRLGFDVWVVGMNNNLGEFKP